jgi:serine/threonine-protein kinase
VTSLGQLADQWPRLNELLDEALALPPAQRSAWLQALPAEHAPLKDTLARLLDVRAGIETGDFLHTLPKVGGSPAPGDGTVADAGAPQPGDEVGPYRLIRELGEGGMGSVWLAERADGQLKRQVALKLPRLTWARGLAERMTRERDILATLEHPHIARLYDAGVDKLGRPWLALEYVQGRPIDAYAKDKALTVRQRVELLLQVCEAVAYAHSRLVIHRDLKPSNILVTDDGQVRLLDFGIAKLLEGDRAVATALTELAGRALTPDYASPEQIQGAPIGTASDVYSLGVVAYELLTGVRPYRLKRGSTAELEEAIATVDPPLAGDIVADKSTRRLLRGDLSAILNKALKKNASERYATMTALGEDLQRWLRGAPVRAQPDRAAYRLRKFVRRHAIPVGAGATVAATVAVAAAVSIGQAIDARAQARLAEAAVDKQAAVRELYVEAMNTLAATASSSPTELGRPHAVSHVLWETMKGMLLRYGDSPPQREAILQAVMLQLSFTGDFEGALEVGQQYLAHLKQHGAPAHDVIDAHAAVARSLEVLGRSADSIALLREGVAWAPGEMNDEEQRTRLNIASELGGRLLAQGDLVEAARLLHQVEDDAARHFPRSRERADNLLRLARLNAGTDDAAALRYAQLGHDTLLASGTANRDALLFSHAGVAAALALNGRLAEAQERYAQAHALAVETYGRADPDTLTYFGQWIGVLSMQGQHDAARSALQGEIEAAQSVASAGRDQALVLLQARAVENEMMYGDVQRALSLVAPTPERLLSATPSLERLRLMAAEARAFLLARDPATALARLDAALASLTPGQLQLAPAVSLRLVRVAALRAGGGAADALDAARSIVGELERRMATRSWGYVVALELEALASTDQGDVPHALATLERASTAAAQLAPPDLERAESLLRRARVHATVGQRDEARRLATQARDLLAAQYTQSPRLAEARELQGQ